MKLLRSVLAISFLLMGLGTPNRAVVAQGTTPPKTFQSIFQQYGLKSINEIPSGIEPLQFNTPEELEEFLLKVNRSTAETRNYDYFDSLLPSDEMDLTNLINGNTYTVVTKKCSTSLGYGTTKFNTWADIKVGIAGGSFGWISSVLKTYTGLTGITTFASLSNDYSYVYNQTATSVSVKGGGIVDVYIVVKGVFKLYSVPVSCSFTYRLY